MRVLLSVLAGLLLALGLGVLLSRDTGTVMLTWGEWVIETSVSFFVILAVTAAVVVYVIFRIIGGAVRLPRELSRSAARRRERRSEKYLADGLMFMMEGNWRSAERAFRRGAAHGRNPVVNYLWAARAAQAGGDDRLRDHYLSLAQDLGGDGGTLAIGLTQAELQLGHRQTEQAYATLRHLEENRPGQKQVRRLLLDASAELNDWEQALTMLRDLERRHVLTPAEARGRQLRIYAGLLHDAARHRDRARLDEEWNRVPRRLRREPHLIHAYVDECLRFTDSADCEPLLRKSINRAWDPALVRLYGLAQGKDPGRQLRHAESWSAGHGRDPALLLALGRLSRRNGLWGKARNYLEECLRLAPGPEVCAELAGLLEQQGQHQAAADLYRKGLTLVTGEAAAQGAAASEPPVARITAGTSETVAGG